MSVKTEEGVSLERRLGIAVVAFAVDAGIWEGLIDASKLKFP